MRHDIELNVATDDENELPTRSEVIAFTTFPIISVFSAAEALESYGWTNQPFFEDIPGSDHLSSVTGSYAVGIAGGALTERFASRLESKGSLTYAERVRRFGNTMTVLGSLASQIAIETSTKGVGDKWDVVVGTVATLPGIIAGRGATKSARSAKKLRKSRAE